MAYGLLLYKEIETPQGDQRVEIYKDGFSGTAVEIAGLHADGITISKDSQSLTQPITTSVLTLRLSDCGEVDYSQFFTPNATLFKVVWQTRTGGAWSTRWTGFITPDSYTENLAYRDTLTLTARDNIGRLGEFNFDMTLGQLSRVGDIIQAGLTKAEVAMTLTTSTRKRSTSLGIAMLCVNTSLFADKTWRDALETLLTGLGLTLAWNDGNSIELRDISQAPANTQAAFFINKSGFRQIRPAWRELTVEQDYGLRENFYEGQFTKADAGDGQTFTPSASSKWSAQGGLALLNPYLGCAAPLETLFVPIGLADDLSASLTYTEHIPVMDRGIKLSLRCCNSYWGYAGTLRGIATSGTLNGGQGISQVPRYYGLRYRFNIFMTVGTTKYVLRETWEVYDPATIAEPYLYFSMPSTQGGINRDEEVEIYIGGMPGAGDMEVVVYPPLAYYYEDDGESACISAASQLRYGYGRITDISMAVDELTGGLAKTFTINAVHNVQGQLSVTVGQVPERLGNTLLYLGGIFNPNGSPATRFRRDPDSSATTYFLLELVAREHITYQNNNYDALSGTMMAQAAFRFDKGITYGGKTYRLVGASLAVLSNTLSVQLLQEEAAFDDTAYTITTTDSEGRTSSSGTGGIGQGAAGGGSDRFFTAIRDEETGDTTGAKALYDLFIQQTPAQEGSGSGSGTPEVLKNISEVLRHLTLTVVNAGDEDEETILTTDLTFASEHGLVAGGIGGTGGGGGGGSLADLADVTLTALAGGDILRYDALTSHWVNGPLQVALSALTDVAIASTPSNGQALVYDSTAGKWKPGNVDTTITAQMILTALGNTPVARATADASGNTITSTYLAQSSFTAANIASTLGNTYVANATYASSAGVATSATYDTNAKLLATQEWVTGQGYITSSALSGYMLSSDFTAANIVSTLGNTAVANATYAATAGVAASATYDTNAKMLATQDWVTARGYLTSTDIADMATQTWVGQQGYLTSSALTGYATETWVTGTALANYATQSWVGSYFVSTITDSTVQANLTIGTSSSGKLLTVYGTTSSALAIRSGSSNVANLYHDGSWLQVSSALYVQGNIAASGNIVAGSASDARLKDDITAMDINAAADVLAGLRPVDFRWNADAARLGGLSGVSRGFIAGEYNRIIPNATRKIWGIYDAIDYQQTIPYLTAGWQQHNMRLRILEGEIRALKEENAALRRALNER